MQTQWPMFLIFAAFVVTFLITRLVTRLIRAGKGPFKDNVSENGVHVHHAVYGIFSLLAGALVNTGASTGVFRCLGAILIGAGASLILDEFALILHLRDVYWENEGRASVQAISLVSACLCLACTGFVPLTGDLFVGGTSAIVTTITGLFFTIIAAWVCTRKGKFRLVLLAIFVPPIAFVGAIRLARPGSPWFEHRYQEGSKKRVRALERVRRSDQRWAPRWIWFANTIAGAPNPQDRK